MRHKRELTVNYQLSTVNYQLSTINCQLSTVNYQLSKDYGTKSKSKGTVSQHRQVCRQVSLRDDARALCVSFKPTYRFAMI